MFPLRIVHKWFFALLLILAGILISLPLISSADESEDEECLDFVQNSVSTGVTFVDKIAEKIVDGASELDIRNAFNISTGSGGKAPGEDLYIRIYREFRNKPYDESVRLTAQRFHYPEEDVKRVLDGAMTPLYLDNGRQLTFTEAQKRLEQFNTSFNEELERQKVIAEVQMELMPIEIFANENLDDSGFDLLDDLDKIETLLFGNDTIERMSFSYANGIDYDMEDLFGSDKDYGPGYDDSADDSADDADDSELFAGSSGSEGDDDDDDNNDYSDNGSERSSDDEKDSDTEDDTSQESRQGQDGENFNPYLCLSSDNDLSDIVADSTASGSEASSSGSVSSDDDFTSGESSSDDDSTSGEGSSDDDSTSSDSSSSSSGGANLFTNSTGYTNADGEEIKLASSGNYGSSVSSLCGDVFCIEILFENEGSPKYPNDEHCITCHVDNINKELYDTIRSNLNPSKITGNLFEANTCKKASLKQMPPEYIQKATSKGMGIVSVIWKPISTPLQEDIVTKLDFQEMYQDILTHPSISTMSMSKSALLYDDTARLFEFCDPDATEEEREKSGCTKRFTENATELAITNAPKGSSYQDVLLEIDKMSRQKAKDAYAQNANFRTEKRLENKSEFYQNLKPEIDQMQNFFTSYLDIITQMSESASSELCEKEEVD